MTSFRSTVFLATLGLVAATAIVPPSPAAHTYTVYPGTVSSAGANLVTTVTTLDVDSCIANCDRSSSCVAVAYDLTLPNDTPCSSYFTAGDLTSPARVVISPASAYGGSVYFKNAGVYMNSFAPAPGSSPSPGPALLIADSNTASCISSPANYPANAVKRGSTQFLYQDVCYSSACPSNTVSAAAQGDYVTCQCAPHFVAGAPVGNEPGNCVACGPNVATCSLTAALTCNAGYKIGEMGAILPGYFVGKTCPNTFTPFDPNIVTPDCVCNDNNALTCDADGALTCSAGFAPVNNDDCSANAPTYVCAPCAGYFTRNSVLTLTIAKGSEFTCIVCPANTSVPAATGRFSTCACGSDSEFYVNTYNKCFYDGVPPTNGVNGMNGKDGMNGTTGAAGINGTNGIDGRNGTNGTTGPSGMDGINGTNGIDGARGPRGRQGRPGPKGKKGKNAPVIIVVAPSHHGHSKDHRHGHGHRA